MKQKFTVKRNFFRQKNERFRPSARKNPASARRSVSSKIRSLRNILYTVFENRIYLLLSLQLTYNLINLPIGTLMARIMTAFTNHTSTCLGIRRANTASSVLPIPLK